jgi:hypothetical protein
MVSSLSPVLLLPVLSRVCLLLIMVLIAIVVEQIGAVSNGLGVIAVPVSGGVMQGLMSFLVVVFPSVMCTFVVRRP